MEGYRSGHNGVVLKTIRAVMSTRVRILHPPPKNQSTSGFARLWTLFIFMIRPGFCFKVLSKTGIFQERSGIVFRQFELPFLGDYAERALQTVYHGVCG